MPAVIKSLHMAREYIRSCVREGDSVIDATAGNGHDTLFLAHQVGDKGKVFSFDLQKEAIERTGQLLENKRMIHRVVLIQDSHERMPDYVVGPVSAIMFNLGYLPGGDRKVITYPEPTVSALSSGLMMLRPKGIITVTIYTGHAGGIEESNAILSFCAGLNQDQFTALHYRIINQVNDPPSLVVIEKIH